MAKIAIIADDLTGASDSGVQFARKGLRTAVLFDAENLLADSEAVAIDTDSRAVAPAEARQRAARAARSAREAGTAHIFKKVDSTLRGNLGPEIDGILDEIPFDLAVIAPAFPKVGRTTVGGRHLLRGIPLEQTEIARDPKCPVSESRIAALLGKQSGRKTGLVDLAVLRQGAEAVLVAVRALRRAGVELVIFDAEEDADLLRIAEALAPSGYRVLWVGSAGLADYLPQALGLTGDSHGAPALPQTQRPVMLVAGSVSPTTRAQVAVAQTVPGTVTVEMDPLQILADGDACSAETGRCESLLLGALARSQDVILVSGASREQVAAAQERGKQLGMDDTGVSNRIAAVLAEIAARVIDAGDLQGLVLTGGDTAKAICRRLGVFSLDVLSELEPGVPLSRLTGSRRMPVVTKAGAFGTEQTLARAMRVLKGEL